MDNYSSQGTCQQCGTSTAKERMPDHLRTCAAQSEAHNGQVEVLYHLRIEDRYGGAYWLDLELSEQTSLGQVDAFLRQIWLDCCAGHTSAFEIDETHYVAPFDARMAVLPSERSMDVILREALQPSDGTFIYDYDFESPTHLMGTVVATREGVRDQKSVRLMARNEPIDRRCADCGNVATHICSYYHENPFLCDAHTSAHSCGRYALLPVVNSPRMGVCSYQGPHMERRQAV